MSKFQAMNALNSNSNVYGVTNLGKYWDHPDYLKGDSVFRTQVNFKFKTHNCISGDSHILRAAFVDDYLYEVELQIDFQKSDLEKCVENYHQILQALQREYSYYEEFVSQLTEFPEQVGEGFRLYKSETERNKSQYEFARIEYELVGSGIEGYRLTVHFGNLKGTKLDRRGF